MLMQVIKSLVLIEDLGARFYFFHFICHDWANDECRLFLQNTAAAMKPGYSKLILGEYILPDKGCPLAPAEGDLAMLTMHSGKLPSHLSQLRFAIEPEGTHMCLDIQVSYHGSDHPVARTLIVEFAQAWNALSDNGENCLTPPAYKWLASGTLPEKAMASLRRS